MLIEITFISLQVHNGKVNKNPRANVATLASFPTRRSSSPLDNLLLLSSIPHIQNVRTTMDIQYLSRELVK